MRGRRRVQRLRARPEALCFFFFFSLFGWLLVLPVILISLPLLCSCMLRRVRVTQRVGVYFSFSLWR